MGWFKRGRWKEKVLEVKLHNSGEANAPPSPLPSNILRIVSRSKKDKEIWRWFVSYGKPKEVLEKLKTELRESMSKSGTAAEQRDLALILEDFDAILPARISKRKLLRYANLLNSTINLWAIGKLEVEIEAKVRLDEKLKAANPKKDPRYEDLFRYADWVYNVKNKNARDVQTWLQRNRKADIVVKDKKVSVRGGVSDKSLEFMVKHAQSISGREALREANRENKIFSLEEFAEREEKLQNAYSKYKQPGHRRKKGHGVPIIRPRIV